MREKLSSLYNEIFGKPEGELIFAKAPGRVNLIGNHVDYNDGFVMPIAINKYIYALASSRKDRRIEIYSELVEERRNIDIDGIRKDESNSWINYICGVIKSIGESGEKVNGANIVLMSDLPANSGLGSSAALEVLTGFILLSLMNKPVDLKGLAILCKKAENEFVGVECGIMDQFTSALARKGMVMFIDCTSQVHDYIPFDEENYAIVVCDTKKERTLATSEYNKRKGESKKGLEIMKANFPGISSFRDIKYENISEVRSDEFTYPIFKRLVHISTEIDRVKKSKDYLLNGDYNRLGREFLVSHESSRNLYEVSCEELDIMVEIGSKFSGVLGSKLTGAGFGGNTLHLTRREVVDKFIDHIKEEYSARTGITPDPYLVETSDGVTLF